MFVEIIQNVAIISFAAIGLYFGISRFQDLKGLPAQLLVGLVFFSIAFLVTMTPIRLPDGATIDARAGPVIVAGLIGGPISGLIAASGGALARSLVGGAFSFSGVLVFFFYAAAGTSLWLINRTRQTDVIRPSTVTLGAGLSLICAALMFFFISPRAVALHWIANDFPLIAIANILSVVMSAVVAWVALRAANDTLQLQSTVEVLKLAKSAGGFGIWQWSPEAKHLEWDAKNMELHGVDPDNFSHSYSDWKDSVHAQDFEGVATAYASLVDKNEPFRVEYRVKTGDGDTRHLQGGGIAVRDGSGTVRRVVGINFDVTERVVREAALVAANATAEKAVAQIQYDAEHDALTGLHNRRALDLHLQHLAKTADQAAEVAFLQIDLDRFKSINDAFGHAVGDFVLIETSRFLEAFEADDTFVARFGGDEFSIVLVGDDIGVKAKALAQSIIAHCQQPLLHENLELHSGASIGIAIGTPVELETLQVDADIAMYHAKRSVGESSAVFDDGMRHVAQRHKRIADGLRVALQRDQIAVYFQPKLRARTRELDGLEVLVRWQHPTLGIVPPCEFLSIAEEIGLQHEIDRRVLQLTFEAANRLCQAGFAIPQVAVNIGLQRLKDPMLLSDLDGLGNFPSQLVFEILETIDLDAMHAEMKWVLDSLRERGVKIEVDDFGTGHASITSLLRLQPDGLKLDRSLVAGGRGIELPSEDLLRALIDIGRASQITITAEGVETEEQAALLERLGCDVLQGYLFAKPMNEADLADWLTLHLRGEHLGRRYPADTRAA